MKITKILVALSFLFAVSTAHAGEMTVTGSMQATYQSEPDKTTVACFFISLHNLNWLASFGIVKG